MKKKGFIFVETVVVLVVVALSLATALSSYSLVARRSKVNYYYNNPSDLYLLYYTFRMGTSASSNYVSSSGTFKYVSASGCSSLLTYMNNCTETLNDLNIGYVGIIPNVNAALTTSSQYSLMDSGMIEFIKQLKRCTGTSANNTCTAGTPIKYIVGAIYRNDGWHYAAINIDTGV